MVSSPPTAAMQVLRAPREAVRRTHCSSLYHVKLYWQFCGCWRSGAANGGTGTIFVSSNSVVQLIVDGGGTPTTTATPISASSQLPSVQVQGGAQLLLGGGVSVNGNLVIQGNNSVVTLFGTNTVAQNVNLTNGGVLTHLAGASNTVLIVSGNMTIDAASLLDVSGKGFGAGTGPGQGIEVYGGFSYYGSGGGYGGIGGNSGPGNAPGGGAYGSITAPTALGSGGGSGLIQAGGNLGETGGAGGGAIQLAVGGIDSQRCDYRCGSQWGTWVLRRGGGGSGGSLYLTAGTLAGNGIITVNGGSAGCSTAGGGGGGRIAAYYTTSSYTGTFSVLGERSSKRSTWHILPNTH